MTTTHTIRPIGTMVIGNDGYHTRIGQVVDHETDRWGTWHVVLANGKFERVSGIDNADRLGIGWKVATLEETRRRGM